MMSAIVCGKRSFFEDIESAATSPTSASPPAYKKFRCSSVTSPSRFSYSPPLSPTRFDQLKALFPEMETQVLENTLKEYNEDLDSAIKSLHNLRVVYANNNSGLTSEEITNMDNGAILMNGDAVPLEPPIRNIMPVDDAQWVDLFVREMMCATSIDDARTRAAGVLGSLEKSLSARAGAEAVQSCLKENMTLKEQIEALLRDNTILKRAVAIQHERQKEHDERNVEMQQLKHLVAQYQEQLHTLQLNNYSLTLHLSRAGQNNSIPGHFHPDVF